MPDGDSRLLRLLLRQAAGDADLEGGRRLPSRISRVDTQTERESLESCNQDAVCETLSLFVSYIVAYLEDHHQSYLINNIAQDLVLVFDTEVLACDDFRLKNKKHDGVVH
jgi:hypothetical protein